MDQPRIDQLRSDQPPADRLKTDTTEQRILALKRRVVREGMLAVNMLENAIGTFRDMDAEAAARVRRADDEVDSEEVEIEQECHALLSLHRPYARGFRTIAFSLRVNADFERVADHASSMAKIVIRLQPPLSATAGSRAGGEHRWPTSLVELMDRVPKMCHDVLRCVLDEDAAAARTLIASDEVIDQQERRLFEEVQEWVKTQGRTDSAVAMGMLLYRAGRELERVGDLMASVSEDVVYLAEGEIIRHAKQRMRPPSATDRPAA
jgi:phosphate transport system protein